MARKKVKQGQVMGLGEKTFNVFMVLLGILITFIALYPIYYVLISSFSKPFFVENGDVLLGIKEFTTASYEAVFKRDGLWMAYGNAIFYTVFGLIANMFFTTTMAYALSKKSLVGRKFFTLFVIFTMWFNAGIIPTYMNFNNMGLLNTRAAIIFGFAIETYNLIIMKSFFQSIPESLEESAKIDGATEVTIFWKIILPLSKATVATIALFTAVGYWNDYFSTVLYINTKEKWALQAVLRYMLTNTNQAMQSAGVTVAAATNVTAATIKAASVVVATVPICAYILLCRNIL